MEREELIAALTRAFSGSYDTVVVLNNGQEIPARAGHSSMEPFGDYLSIYGAAPENKAARIPAWDIKEIRQVTVIPAGTYLVITDGECSEYQVLMLCRTLQDIDMKALRAEFRPEKYSKEHGSYAFAKWLAVDKKVVEEIDYREWNLDDEL